MHGPVYPKICCKLRQDWNQKVRAKHTWVWNWAQHFLVMWPRAETATPATACTTVKATCHYNTHYTSFNPHPLRWVLLSSFYKIQVTVKQWQKQDLNPVFVSHQIFDFNLSFFTDKSHRNTQLKRVAMVTSQDSGQEVLCSNTPSTVATDVFFQHHHHHHHRVIEARSLHWGPRPIKFNNIP